VRVAKAKRRWIRWCRYVAATGTQANPHRSYGSMTHEGQAKAYEDVMYARRYAPIGVRVVWYPKWGSVR
jgi:hypothetical protein